MKKVILKLFIVIFIISSVNLSPITVEAATQLKEVNITVNVNCEKSLDTYVVNQVWYPPTGKYTIGDSSIVGLKCEYDKKRDEWYNNIYGLRPGKTTLIRWHKNNKYIKFNVTVTRAKMDSITSFYGLVKAERNQGVKYFLPEPADKALKEMIKSLNIEQYNSDLERIFEVFKYLHKNVTLTDTDDYTTYDDNSIYSALVTKVTATGSNVASAWALQNMGLDIRSPAWQAFVPWYIINLEGLDYSFDLITEIDAGDFLGSIYHNAQYAGEGTWTDVDGTEVPGSLYYEEGEISDRWAINYRFDVFYYMLSNRHLLRNDPEFRYYLSTDRKTHLPAWIIGTETPQQIMLKGDSIILPEDRLSSNVFSSDESIVKIENNKIIGVKEGIAIVYRYDDTYCDAFYVLVDKTFKSKKLSVNYKPDGKVHTTYKSSDICINRKIINENPYRYTEVWKSTVLYKLDPGLSGGNVRTSYKDGYITTYVINKDGNKLEIFDDAVYKNPNYTSKY